MTKPATSAAALAAALAAPLQAAAAAIALAAAAVNEAAAPPPAAHPVAAAAAAKAAGLEEWEMGGGCEAWALNRPDGKTYLTICSHGNGLPDTLTEPCLAGVYDNDCGSSFICRDDMNFADSLRWALASRAPFEGEQTYFDSFASSRGAPMPVVGACYSIEEPIERYPYGIAESGQLATVTEVSEHAIWIRPAELFEYSDGADEPAHFNAIAFYLGEGGQNGLAEFHHHCVLQPQTPPAVPAAPSIDEMGIMTDALTALIGLVQARLGVEGGDVAGHFWQGERVATINRMIADYIAAEKPRA